MPRSVIGYFVDRESADHAASEADSLGFSVTRKNVEDFGSEDYYASGLPQGATAIIVEEPLNRETELRSVMMRAGATRIQGHGSEGKPTGMTELVEAEESALVRGGGRAPQ